jgi:hypothetical protein
MRYSNYQVEANPFKLAGPPKWWLSKLAEFDPSLVVMPSKQGFYYRLCQRRPPSLKKAMVEAALFNESDTKMLASRGLIPITTILATANWDNPLMWMDLAGRAPHMNGGAEKVIKKLEDDEFSKDMKKRADTEQMIVDRAKDGWKLYQSKTGARVSNAFSKRGRV